MEVFINAEKTNCIIAVQTLRVTVMDRAYYLPLTINAETRSRSTIVNSKTINSTSRLYRMTFALSPKLSLEASFA